MPEVEGFTERIVALIEAAPSQAALARSGGISAGTLINWKRGLGYRESDLREFAEKTGLSLDWLKYGRGDSEAEKLKILKEIKHEKTRPFLASSARGSGEPAELEDGNSPRQKLRLARKAAGITIPDLAKRIGRDASYLRNLEEGIAPISERTVDLLVAALPVLSKEDLMDGSDTPVVISDDGMLGTYGASSKIQLPPGVVGGNYPILSMAQAGGFDAGHDDGYYGYETVFAVGINDRRAFAIIVSGNSMEEKICEGDVVFCSPSTPVKNGAAAVIRTKSDQALIKYWFRVGDTVILESENPDYPGLTFPIQEIAGVWPIVHIQKKGMIIRQASLGQPATPRQEQ